jgi:carbamoyltransferase
LKRSTCYIGLASTFHDSAVSIVNPQGEVVFAEAAERYLQNKRAVNYAPDDLIRLPRLIKKYCGDADLVVAFSWPASVGQRMGRLSRLLKTVAPLFPKGRIVTGNEGFAWPVGSVVGGLEWMAESTSRAGMNLRTSPYLDRPFRTLRFDHHLSHAATACFTGPFDDAAVAIVDGYGGGAACSFFRFSQGKFERVTGAGGWSGGSLGHFYSIVCRLCDFDPVTGEEWKVMGLAPYGKSDSALYKEFDSCFGIDDLRIVMKTRGSKYLLWLEKMRALSQEIVCSPEAVANLAATGQAFFEDKMTELLHNFYKKGVSDNLVLAGGCGLNSTFNGQIIKRTPFKKLHVPSAPGDDGCAIGAALLAFGVDNPTRVKKARTETPYLGSEISEAVLKNCIQFANPEKIRHCPGTIARETAKVLAGGGIIGWMQGRAEFGPRALGNRSILADPRPQTMKDSINTRVKFREKFRPFAPAILHEFGDEYFHDYQETPYMERTLVFKEAVRSKIPAVVHENGSGRLQSVTREWAPKYYDLIKAFHELTGVPLLLNTSFNVMGKPIIHSVEDALGVFHTSGLDALVIDDYLIIK